MKNELENYLQLPDGDSPDSEIVIQTEWEVPDENNINWSIETVIETFNKHSRNRESIKGMLSYTCFLNIDGHHIIHFSQWKDKNSILFFDENDSKERIPELLSNLPINRLGKKEYIPYKTFVGSNKKENTGILIFVKQYFHKPEQTKEWIELILSALKIENPIDGLIKNTYYLSLDGMELLNYALWESNEKYNAFLQHSDPNTKAIWRKVESFSGLIKEKEEIKKHQRFIKIY